MSCIRPSSSLSNRPVFSCGHKGYMKSQCRISLELPGFRPQEPRIVVSCSWDTIHYRKNNLWTCGISIKDYAKGMTPITGKTRQPMPSGLWVLHHFAFSRHMLDFMRLATASSIKQQESKGCNLLWYWHSILKYSWTSLANVLDDLEFSLMLESVF